MQNGETFFFISQLSSRPKPFPARLELELELELKLGLGLELNFLFYQSTLGNALITMTTHPIRFHALANFEEKKIQGIKILMVDSPKQTLGNYWKEQLQIRDLSKEEAVQRVADEWQAQVRPMILEKLSKVASLATSSRDAVTMDIPAPVHVDDGVQFEARTLAEHWLKSEGLFLHTYTSGEWYLHAYRA